ncbi:asparagine synthase-related protein [Actinomycetes bacterium KLBMP 9797]
MPSIVTFSVPGNWFVALPDVAAALAVARSIKQHATRFINYPSGRPWILGRWSDRDVAAATAGPAAVAVLGEHDVAADALAPVAAQLGRTGDVATLRAPWPGSYHLVGSVGGELRVQGTVSALRRVFAGSIGTVTVAADRADLLAALLDADLDPARLAAHLLDPQTLHPITGQPVWRGLSEVPVGHYLRVGRDATARTVRWWSPPDPVVPLADGARSLRAALTAAVRVRTRGHDLVTCDLGGVDSTAVCAIAARAGDGAVVAFTVDARDPLADDVTWARHTVAGLGIEHHTVPGDDMPLTYAGVDRMADRWDEPCATAVDRDRWLAVIARAAARGSRVHLTGIGGDELLGGSTAHLHTLARRRPLLARRQIRGFAAKHRWPTAQVLRQLLANESYGDWLRRVEGHLTDAPPPLTEPMLDWGGAPRLPPWATRDAVEAVRRLVRTEVAARPISPRRGQHRELAALQLVSRMTRQLQQLAAERGVRYAAPYYDDAVLTAALSVRPAERITPWRYKPLIAEAMRGVVPEPSRLRATKANAMVEEEVGLRVHRDALLALWEDSALARRGLVDARALRDVCARPLPAHLQIGVLHQTVAAEVWLRAVEKAAGHAALAS